MSAAPYIPPTFSWLALFSMFWMFAGSMSVFYALTRRWTVDRDRAAMRQWADERRFRMRTGNAVPLPAAFLAAGDARAQVVLTRGPVSLVRWTTADPVTRERIRWHALVRQTEIARVPAGFRPVSAGRSVLDLFTLTDFPAVMAPHRFVAYATDLTDARKLAQCGVVGLLPADIGLLIHGPFIMLDFSSRPFDAVEFDRMRVVVEQLVPHLPAK